MLWAVVLLKFVTPPVVCWPGNVERFSLQLRSIVPLPANASSSAFDDRTRPRVSESSPVARTANRSWPLAWPSVDVAPRAAGQSRMLPEYEIVWRALLAVLAGAWPLGSTIGTVRQVRRIIRHASLIRLGRRAPEELTSEINAVAMQVGLRPPQAVVTGGIDSPFVCFIGRLRLVWPEKLTGFD